MATQRKILKLEQRVFKLEQQISRLKAKHERETAALKAENQKLRDQPIVMSEKKRQELIERRRRALEGLDQKT